MKKMAEKVEMGLDAQKSFAQMYEDKYMNKRIGGKMMKLDPIIIQEDRNEIRAGKTVGVYRQACSGIPLVVRFVGRD